MRKNVLGVADRQLTLQYDANYIRDEDISVGRYLPNFNHERPAVDQGMTSVCGTGTHEMLPKAYPRKA